MLKKKKKGFTLIELLASIALMAMVFSVVTAVCNTGNKLYSKGEKELDSQNNCKKAQSSIRSDLRMGSEIFTDRAHLKDVLGLTDAQYNSLSYTPLIYIHLRNPLKAGTPDEIDGYLYKLQNGNLIRVNVIETKNITNFNDYKFYTDDTKQNVGSFSGGGNFMTWLYRQFLLIAFGIDAPNPLDNAQYQLPDSVLNNIRITLDNSENIGVVGYYYNYDSSYSKEEALEKIQEYSIDDHIKLAVLAFDKNTSDKYVIVLREAEDPIYQINYTTSSNEKTIVGNVNIVIGNANIGNAISVSISGYNGGAVHYDEIMSVGLE